MTRIECARLVHEAEGEISSAGSLPSQATVLQIELKKEFRAELDAPAGGMDPLIRLESVYANFMGISRKSLNDSYHFGQTIINNDGRPLPRAFKSFDGFRHMRLQAALRIMPGENTSTPRQRLRTLSLSGKRSL